MVINQWVLLIFFDFEYQTTCLQICDDKYCSSNTILPISDSQCFGICAPCKQQNDFAPLTVEPKNLLIKWIYCWEWIKYMATL